MTSTAVDNAPHSGSTIEFRSLTLRTSRPTVFLCLAVNLVARSVCPPRWTNAINGETGYHESMNMKKDALCNIQTYAKSFKYKTEVTQRLHGHQIRITKTFRRHLRREINVSY